MRSNEKQMPGVRTAWRLVTATREPAMYGERLAATVPSGWEWCVVAATMPGWTEGAASPVRFVRENEPPGGLYAALNQGLGQAGEWEWFSYINDDDRLGPDFAALAERHCRVGNEGVIGFGRVAMIDEGGRYLYDFPSSGRMDDLPALLAEGIMPFTQQGMIAHREVWERLGGFDASYRLAGDLDFWVRAHRAGYVFRFYNLRVGEWRLRKGQLSGDYAGMAEETSRCLAGVRAEAPGRWTRELARLRFRLRNASHYARRFWRLRCLRQARVFG